MYSLQFTLQGLPEPLNKLLRMHWAKRKSYNDAWYKEVHYRIAQYLPLKPLPRAKLTLVRYSSFEPDPDGLVGSFKPILDSLVKSHVIENDRYSNIGMPNYVWIKAKKNEGRIKIFVDEV